jgi:hypothetical protein
LQIFRKGLAFFPEKPFRFIPKALHFFRKKNADAYAGFRTARKQTKPPATDRRKQTDNPAQRAGCASGQRLRRHIPKFIL